MRLSELQMGFRDWLVTSSVKATLRRDISDGSTTGLAIYQNNYRAQLVGCLEVSYPQLRALLGDETFHNVAITHIDSHPPHAWTLDAYGVDFGDTLLEMFPRNPDVHELAWIEWALSESFVAPDVEPMSNDELRKIDWDAARLYLSPSLRQRTTMTNAEAIWSALQDGVAAPESEMLDVPGGLVVWRREFTSRLKLVDSVELAALMSLHDDDRFTSLCDALVEHLGEDEGVAKTGTLLADWLSAGIVVGIRLNP